MGPVILVEATEEGLTASSSEEPGCFDFACFVAGRMNSWSQQI